jgi:hypothetical protein
MKIFLSYASEDRVVAGQVNGALTSEGHQVFFSDDDIHPTEAYDKKIREDIEKSDLFIFLISPDSVRKGKYTLTELNFAEGNRESLAGYVMPVMVRETPLKAVPPSLTRLNILKARGDLVAEVAGAVARIAKIHPERPSRRAWARMALAGLGAFALGAAAGLYPVWACFLGWAGCFGERPSVSVVTVACVPKQKTAAVQPAGEVFPPRYASRAFVLVKGSFNRAVAEEQIGRLKESVGTKELSLSELKADTSYARIVERLPGRLETNTDWRVLEQEVLGEDVRFPLPKLDPEQSAHFFVEIAGKPGTGQVTIQDDKTGIRELANLVLQEDARTEEDPEYEEVARKVTRVTLNLFEGDIVCWENENVSPTQ